MLVREWMTCNVITLGLASTVLDAAAILRDKNIRQFPVIDTDGKLVGIVSDRDIRDAMPSKFLPGDGVAGDGGGLLTLTAADIMTPDPFTVTPETAMDIVADLIVKNKIGGLPVVDGEELIGIITQADVLRFLSAATGALRGGTQFAIRMEARPGPLAALLDDLRVSGIKFTSVFTSHEPDNPSWRHVFIRVDLGDWTVEKAVEYLQGKYDLLYYVNEGITVDLA